MKPLTLILVLVPCLSFTGCVNRSTQNLNTSKIESTKPDSINVTQVLKETDYYVFNDDKFKQLVKIKYLNDSLISFVISTENIPLAKKDTISGIAIRLTYFELEQDVDENGLGYGSNEYLYKKDNCMLFIRIRKNLESLILNAYNCSEMPRTNERLFTLKTILRRKGS